jgi:hypothetical protein
MEKEEISLNPTLFRAVGVVTFALLFYSIAVVTEQRQSVISKRALLFLTADIICEISSTGLNDSWIQESSYYRTWLHRQLRIDNDAD